MFAAQQVLDDQDGTDITFELVSQAADGTVRLDGASTLTQPRKLVIKHSVSGKGSAAVDRHLVQLTETVVSGADSATGTVNLTFAMPRNPLITEAKMYDLASLLLDFITGGSAITPPTPTTNIQKLLRGES